MLVLIPRYRFKRLSLSLLRTRSSSALPPPPPPPPPPLHIFLSDPPTDFRALLRTHSLIITAGRSTNPFFAAKLVSLYAAFHRPDISNQVFFDSAPNPDDTFLWNSVIKSHFSNGDFPLSLRLYRRMRAYGAQPDHFTVPMVVSACAELLELVAGSCVHGVSIKFGLFGGGDSVGVGSSLVYMYSKCGVVGDAVRVFEEMPETDVVSWTALIIGCVRNGERELGLGCLKDMHGRGEKPNSRTVEGGLQACGSLGTLLEGKCLHGYVVKTGIGCCCFVKSSTFSMYSKCEDLEEAVLAFHEVPMKDIVSWTAIVGNYARKGLLFECLAMFQAMLLSGVEPDGVFTCCLLMAFANSSSIYGGKAFHGVILRRNFEFNPSVANSLLSMYCKLELLDAAKMVFDTTDKRDAESWSLMVFGYGKMGLSAECLNLFRKLQLLGLGLESNLDSLVAVISSCSQLGELQLGQSIQCYAIKNEMDGDTSVLNSLVGMYGRCGKLHLARKIFDQMRRDVITWNTLIAAYAHSGYSNDALTLFDQMFLENIKPNSTTLTIVLSACSNIAALHQGERIHNYIKENGLEYEVPLSTALVDMYAKCGQLKISREVFDSMKERDVVAWNVMILGYGSHGYAEEALEIFKHMEKTGAIPNSITFLAVLSSCSHAGLVEEGRYIFSRMRDHSIIPTCKHYACMVDLLGRLGSLNEAEALILAMPTIPDGGIWGALLGACKIHNDIEMGERAAKRAVELEPENDGYYIILSNMYNLAGRWEEAAEVREMMKNRGVRKRAGWSSTELDGKVHIFVVEDKSHPQFGKTHEVLEALLKHIEVWDCVARGS